MLTRFENGNLRALAASSLLACGALLSGCGSTTATTVTVTPTPIPYTGPTFTVKVLAGATPLVGSAVQFYTAGVTGNGSAPTALLTASVKTDATGTAAVPANYTCPSSTGMTYLTATGGTVGSSSTGNSTIVLLAAVGACSTVAVNSSFVIDEATTVAAVYALQAFYSGGSIGASASNLTGITNAFATAATLANVTTGSTTGTMLPANSTSPAPRVNAISNVLNACLVKPANCTSLYGVAPSGTPANTLEAVYDLARTPTVNVASIYTASLLSTAYAPTLTASPTDWTMFINYTGGGMNNTSSLGIDSTGSVWVANYFQVASKFSPVGLPIFANGVTGYGLSDSYGMAVDTSDNAWFANEPTSSSGSSVSVISPAGIGLSGSGGYTAGGLNYPISIAIDPNGTSWIVDYGNSHVTLLNKAGAAISGEAGYTTPLFAFPVVVALDGNHFGWIGNQSDTTVTKVAPDGSTFQNFNCCNGASGIAVDASNNIWVANFYGASVSMISSAGVVIGNASYTGLGSINHPQGIAIDGAGTVFVANYRANYLSKLAGAASGSPGASLTPAAGLGGDASLLEAFALAIDASGNVWVSNQGDEILTKFIGLAVPVKTPLSGIPQLP